MSHHHHHRSNLHLRPLTFVLCCVLMMLIGTGCGQASAGDPPLAKGWTWYHDSQYAFRVPVPPGWNVGTYLDYGMTNQVGIYDVFFFPPGSNAEPGPVPWESHPELMAISIYVGIRDWQPSDDPNFQPEPHPIFISGAQAILYDNDPPEYGVQRSAVTHFGGHQYMFLLHSGSSTYGPPSPAQIQQDLALYHQVLQGFTYTGK